MLGDQTTLALAVVFQWELCDLSYTHLSDPIFIFEVTTECIDEHTFAYKFALRGFYCFEGMHIPKDLFVYIL